LGGSECLPGRAGRACAACAPQFYTTDDGSCAQCPDSSLAFWITLVVIFFVGVELLQGSLEEATPYETNDQTAAETGQDQEKRKVKRSRSLGSLASIANRTAGRKVGLVFSVVASRVITLGFYFPSLNLVQLPAAVREIINSMLRFVMLDIQSFMTSPECEWKFEPKDVYAMKMAMPIIFVAVFLLTHFVKQANFRRKALRDPGLTKYYEMKARKTRNLLVAVAVFLYFVSLFPIGVQQSLEAFVCTEQPELQVTTLNIAPEYECNLETDSPWALMVVLAICSLLFYLVAPSVAGARKVFGCTCTKSSGKLCCFMLGRPQWVDKSACKRYNDGAPCYECSHCDDRQRFGWVFEKYRASKYYWETVVISRKVCVVLVVVCFHVNRSLQLSMQMVLIAAHLGATVRAQPYLTDKEIQDRVSAVENEDSPKFSWKRCGTNNLLEVALSIGELCFLIVGLSNEMLEASLSPEEASVVAANVTNSSLRLGNVTNSSLRLGNTSLITPSSSISKKVSITEEIVAARWPALNVFLHVVGWVGVVVFAVAFAVFGKDLMVACWASIRQRKVRKERKRLKRERSREAMNRNQNHPVSLTKVVPHK
jgi:hypothetical protein